MWVKFTDDYDWRQGPNALVAYKKGMVLNVTKVAGEAAIEAKKAEATTAPKKGEESHEKPARLPRATGKLPTEADLGEAEAPGGGAPVQ